MNSIETLATFFGWCIVINIVVILLFFGFLSVWHDWVARLNARLFGITEEEAKTTFFRLFMHFRLALVVLNIVPYIALKIMA